MNFLLKKGNIKGVFISQLPRPPGLVISQLSKLYHNKTREHEVISLILYSVFFCSIYIRGRRQRQRKTNMALLLEENEVIFVLFLSLNS